MAGSGLGKKNGDIKLAMTDQISVVIPYLGKAKQQLGVEWSLDRPWVSCARNCFRSKIGGITRRFRRSWLARYGKLSTLNWEGKEERKKALRQPTVATTC